MSVESFIIDPILSVQSSNLKSLECMTIDDLNCQCPCAGCSLSLWKLIQPHSKPICKFFRKISWKNVLIDFMSKDFIVQYWKWHYVYVFTLFTKNPIILSLFKIDILKFTISILTILICSSKTYLIGLCNLILMNIFFTIKYRSFWK